MRTWLRPGLPSGTVRSLLCRSTLFGGRVSDEATLGKLKNNKQEEEGACKTAREGMRVVFATVLRRVQNDW
jgi:hypothetical protein